MSAGDPFAGDCAGCGRALLDHTLGELRVCTDIRVPYEHVAAGPVPYANPLADDGVSATHITCLAATFSGDLPGVGPIILPAIIFRFEAWPGSPPIPEISLILNDDMVDALAKLVPAAAAGALQAARAAR